MNSSYKVIYALYECLCSIKIKTCPLKNLLGFSCKEALNRTGLDHLLHGNVTETLANVSLKLIELL